MSLFIICFQCLKNWNGEGKGETSKWTDRQTNSKRAVELTWEGWTQGSRRLCCQHSTASQFIWHPEVHPLIIPSCSKRWKWCFILAFHYLLWGWAILARIVLLLRSPKLLSMVSLVLWIKNEVRLPFPSPRTLRYEEWMCLRVSHRLWHSAMWTLLTWSPQSILMWGLQPSLLFVSFSFSFSPSFLCYWARVSLCSRSGSELIYPRPALHSQQFSCLNFLSIYIIHKHLDAWLFFIPLLVWFTLSLSGLVFSQPFTILVFTRCICSWRTQDLLKTHFT